MSIIYWIETLNGICVVLFLLSIVFAIFGIMAFLEGISEDEDKAISIGKKSLVASLFFLIAFAFIPSTSAGYKILGIGGTIDYLKDNDAAKQLPEKCIKALDILLDKQINEIKNDSIK